MLFLSEYPLDLFRESKLIVESGFKLNSNLCFYHSVGQSVVTASCQKRGNLKFHWKRPALASTEPSVSLSVGRPKIDGQTRSSPTPFKMDIVPMRKNSSTLSILQLGFVPKVLFFKVWSHLFNRDWSTNLPLPILRNHKFIVFHITCCSLKGVVGGWCHHWCDIWAIILH